MLTCNFETMDLIVTVPDDRVNFVKKLLRELNLAVKPAAKAKPTAGAPKLKKYTPQQQDWIDGFREALHEADLAAEGKIKLKPARQLLDELRS